MKKNNLGVLLILLAVGVLFFLEKDPAPIVGDPVKDPKPEDLQPGETPVNQIVAGEPLPDVIQIKPPKQVFDTPVENDSLPKQDVVVSSLDGNAWSPQTVATASQQNIMLN